jgi:hypothetical protein
MWTEKPLTPRKIPLEKDDGEILSNGKKVYRSKWFERAVANEANFAVSDVHLIFLAFRKVILQILKEDAILNLTGLFKIYHRVVERNVRNVATNEDMGMTAIHEIRILPSKALLSLFRPERYSSEFWNANNRKRAQYLKSYKEKLKAERHAKKENDQNLSKDI